MNVYVLSTATELARQGVAVDIFTRATRPSQGEIVEVLPNLRVVNIVAGPYEGLAKEELSTQLAAFTGESWNSPAGNTWTMTSSIPIIGSLARWAG